MAPAIVGKPLASLRERDRLHTDAASAQSAAVLAGLVVGAGALAGAALCDGLVRLTLLCAGIGIPAVMIVESSFWRDAFTAGSRRAGGLLSAAYGFQVVVVVVAVVLSASSAVVVLSPFAALAAFGVVSLLVRRHLTVRGARTWVTVRRPSWMPYVIGVAASVVLVQSIPVVITATAGFESASVYRAGELAFGGTNLLIGITSQNLLARGTDRPRRVYARSTVALAVVAVLNGLVLFLLPDAVLRLLVGPIEPLLREVLPIITVQRCALAVSSIGAFLLIPRLTPRRAGLLDVTAAALSFVALLVGSLVLGLSGALGGLALAEVVLAGLYYVILRKQTGVHARGAEDRPGGEHDRSAGAH
ncbi:hypothetical protein GCM10027451_43280 [Geodermatophilus aquaeductus]|uniref:Membrane protein involved in the export of O-antigen and teichoic acid n=1 Tax=Geodermatophilus aquaeductus TaxID=1564161 RepID=A0A521FR40_9ACTN|nr:hypothetical protein [Geodermatophilus aquaeductus]SMO98524.1 hypothetical protein SAMN06273567_11397 [Geodermatophilus aquaeductus]